MSISKRESRVLPDVVFFLLNNALFNEEIGGEGGENCRVERVREGRRRGTANKGNNIDGCGVNSGIFITDAMGHK